MDMKILLNYFLFFGNKFYTPIEKKQRVTNIQQHLWQPNKIRVCTKNLITIKFQILLLISITIVYNSYILHIKTNLNKIPDTKRNIETSISKCYVIFLVEYLKKFYSVLGGKYQTKAWVAKSNSLTYADCIHQGSNSNPILTSKKIGTKNKN